jgi:hypothetical protein
MASPAFGTDYGFLSVDSEYRIDEVRRACARAQSLGRVLPDDRMTHVLAGSYLASIGELEADTDALLSFVEAGRAQNRSSAVSAGVIASREIYESFFNGPTPRNVHGWSDDLISVAEDLYASPPFEIALSVWVAHRIAERRRFTSSIAKPPTLEFDHKLLGYGKYVQISESLLPGEPFFEVQSPVFGVGYCGVLNGYLAIDSAIVDVYAREILEFYREQWPSAYDLLMDIDAPLPGRPLGFASIPFAAEAFVRQLTIEEGAEFVFEQISERENAPPPTEAQRLERPEFKAYLREVVGMGALASPATFDADPYRDRAVELTRAIYSSYLKRENAFDAWLKHVEHVKALDIAIRDFATSARQVRSLFESRCRGGVFTAYFLRETLRLLEDGKSIADVGSHLEVLFRERPAIERDLRIERVAGPTSPAIVR